MPLPRVFRQTAFGPVSQPSWSGLPCRVPIPSASRWPPASSFSALPPPDEAGRPHRRSPACRPGQLGRRLTSGHQPPWRRLPRRRLAWRWAARRLGGAPAVGGPVLRIPPSLFEFVELRLGPVLSLVAGACRLGLPLVGLLALQSFGVWSVPNPIKVPSRRALPTASFTAASNLSKATVGGQSSLLRARPDDRLEGGERKAGVRVTCP